MAENLRCGKVGGVRLALLAVATLAPVLVHAERLIFLPIGSKIPFRTARFEWLQATSGRDYRGYLGFGVNRDFDAEILLDGNGSKTSNGSLSFSYNFISPIVDAMPGISVGVTDLLDRTRSGREYYIATTFAQGIEGAEFADRFDITFGYQAGRRNGLFVGVRLPFNSNFSFLTEFDGNKPTAALEYRVNSALALRLIGKERQCFLDLRYAYRF